MKASRLLVQMYFRLPSQHFPIDVGVTSAVYQRQLPCSLPFSCVLLRFSSQASVNFGIFPLLKCTNISWCDPHADNYSLLRRGTVAKKEFSPQGLISTDSVNCLLGVCREVCSRAGGGRSEVMFLSVSPSR